MRILLLECSPMLRRWPRSLRIWQDHLPTLSTRARFWSEIPEPRIDWPERAEPAGRPMRMRFDAVADLQIRSRWQCCHGLWHSSPEHSTLRRRSRGRRLELSTILRLTSSRFSSSRYHFCSCWRTAAARHRRVMTSEQYELRAGLGRLSERWPRSSSASRGAGQRRLLGGCFDQMAFRDDLPAQCLGAALNAAETAGGKVSSLRPIGYMTDGRSIASIGRWPARMGGLVRSRLRVVVVRPPRYVPQSRVHYDSSFWASLLRPQYPA